MSELTKTKLTIVFGAVVILAACAARDNYEEEKKAKQAEDQRQIEQIGMGGCCRLSPPREYYVCCPQGDTKETMCVPIGHEQVKLPTCPN